MSLPSDWRQQFDRLGPWVTRFTIDGQVVGGDYDAGGDVRIRQFAEAFQAARSILELGSLEGGHSLALAALPGVRKIVAVEGRRDNLERARLMARLSGFPPIHWVEANIEAMAIDSLNRFGAFDAAFVVGLLYHLPRPWELLLQLRQITDSLFIWTHYAGAIGLGVGGYRGEWYTEGGLADPLSGLSPRSFWPARAELVRMLADCGFPKIEILDEGRRNGSACITLTARAR